MQIKYTVTNNTRITRTLTIQPITATTQSTAGSGICASPFTLAPGQSCVLVLLVDASALAASGTTSVTLGGVAATNVHVISDGMLTAVTPPHTAGLVSVVVTHADGRTSLLPNSYTYITTAVGLLVI